MRNFKYVGICPGAREFLRITKHQEYTDKGSFDSYTPDGDYSDAHMKVYTFTNPVRTGDHEVKELYEDVQMVFDTKKTRYIITCLRSEWSIYRQTLWSLNEVNQIVFG